MSNENMDTWNRLKQPPPSALKKITGGRLKGFTDVNPMWRCRAMTAEFGECGVGWKYEIKRLWTEPGAEGQICAFAEISLFVATPELDGRWGSAIPGIGGSMLIVKETRGLHTSDEAYKMAVTDALSVSMKMLGVAADIYEGLWDGSKYVEEKIASPKPDRKPAHKPPAQESIPGKQPGGYITAKHWNEMKRVGAEFDLNEADVIEFIKYVANKNNIDPKDIKIAELILPKSNFITAHVEYGQHTRGDSGDVDY